MYWFMQASTLCFWAAGSEFEQSVLEGAARKRSIFSVRDRDYLKKQAIKLYILS